MQPKYYKKEIKRLLEEKVYDDVIAMDAVCKFLNNDLIQYSQTRKEEKQHYHLEDYKGYKIYIDLYAASFGLGKLSFVISNDEARLGFVSTVKISHTVKIITNDNFYSNKREEYHSVDYDYGATLRESVEQAKAIIDFVIDEKENAKRKAQDLFGRITIVKNFEEFE